MKQYIKDYFENPALDQTKLKLLLGNDPKQFLNPPVFDSNTMKRGSLVDCLLTDPSEFEVDYYVTEIETLPTDAIKNIIVEYYNVIQEFPSLENDDTLLKVITDANYQNTYLPATKLKKVHEAGDMYLEDLKKCNGRVIITKEEYETAKAMVSNMQNTFPEILMNTNPDIEVKYQVPLYGQIHKVDCKGLIDILVINHSEKTVKIIDLKTFYGHPLDFSTTAHSHRYDIQLAFYQYLYDHLFPSDYKSECYYLVSSPAYPEIPVLFKLSSELLKIGMVGRDAFQLQVPNKPELFIQKNEVEGFLNLLNKYKFYLEYGFNKDQRIVLNNSRFKMDWSGIV